MNAPKKIWFDIDDCSAGPVQFADDEILYIRADIVDELVEALKWMMAILVVETETDVKAIDRAEAALAKLEESHD